MANLFIGKVLLLALSIALINKSYAQQKVIDFSLYERTKLGPTLMESTFYIYDPLDENKSGTCFLLAHITDIDLSTVFVDSTFLRINKKTIYKFTKYKYCEILVTAAHVLRNIEGNYANLILRKKRGDDYETFDYPVKIRENGIPLWQKADENIDVAVMAIIVPENAVYSILVDYYLVSDRLLEEININSGDDISCVGFPYKTASDDRYFPILRSGKYASYRGSHSLNDNNFLFDFRIYPGNSGGPVFTDLKISVTKDALPWYTTAAILGVVSEQLKARDKIHQIEVAKVIPAKYVSKCIEKLSLPVSYFKDYDAKKNK